MSELGMSALPAWQVFIPASPKWAEGAIKRSLNYGVTGSLTLNSHLKGKIKVYLHM